MGEYRSGRGLALAAILLVAAQLVLDLVGVAAVGAILVWPAAGAAMLRLTGLSGTLSSLGYIAALIVFLCWVYRAVANLGALGSDNLRFTPSGAVWSFLIPFVNLVQPHRVMATIWTESQPLRIDDHGYALPRKTSLVTAWWALVWIASVYTHSLAFLDAPTTTAEVEQLAVLVAIQVALWLAAGAIFIFMVWRAQRRQEEQWLDLERRRAAPAPTGDVLR
jgi:hypothetical protein